MNGTRNMKSMKTIRLGDVLYDDQKRLLTLCRSCECHFMTLQSFQRHLGDCPGVKYIVTPIEPLAFDDSNRETRLVNGRQELTHSLQYENSIRDVGLLNKSVPFAIRDHCGPKLASLLRYSVVYDNRDGNVFPTRGIYLKSVNEYCGLGGNVAYTSSTAHGELNVPLFAGLVAQFCARVGVVKETKNTTQLPISSLFYCGGPLTLRGFKFGGAGPVVEGTPIGAQSFWCTGAHLWAPLPFAGVFKNLASHFRMHFFYNIGNNNSFNTENMRSAFGMGLAVKLAERARIELNYCVPVRHQNTDKIQNGFQFGIGYEFL
ncbi:GM20162 [Drosophila sechellia]|uniref:GM20162 n=1 Tax=Drosophila sechellia TaxID=7238 RepID=B4HRS9_DROSE|nr:GM20162 [Drosophila sechellia]